MADQPARLCIVSGDRLRGADFVAALEASLWPQDALEIIIDRRSGEPSGEWERSADRRRRPQVDLALKTNGFAIVPAPSPWSESSRPESLRSERPRLSMLLPSAPSPGDDDESEDEERLEAIRSFKRERSSSLVPWLIAALAVVGAAAFVLSPVGYALKQSLAHRVQPQSPGPKPESASGTPDANTAPPQSSAVAERPSVVDAPSRAPQVPTAERPTPEAAPPPSAPEPQPSPSRDATRRDTRTPSTDSGASARAANEQVSRERSRSTDGSRPDSSASGPKPVASAPGDPGSRVRSPRFMGLPRVELSREPGASGTYVARVLDPAGRALRDAEVLLIAHMPDGTVENIRMDYSPDHGAFRGALPPSRSSPTDLRVRVITGDRRVEVPLGP